MNRIQINVRQKKLIRTIDINPIKGGNLMKALILNADNFEDMELFYPLNRLKEEGVTVKLASMKKYPCASGWKSA